MLSELPAGAQLAVNLGLGVAAFFIGCVGYFKTKKAGAEDGGDLTVLGVEDVTNNRVVRKFLDAQQKQLDVLTAIANSITLYTEHVIEREDALARIAEIDRLAAEKAERIVIADRETEERRKRAAGGRARTAEHGG